MLGLKAKLIGGVVALVVISGLVLSGMYLKARLDATKLQLEVVTAQAEANLEAAERVVRQTEALMEQMTKTLQDRADRDRAIVEETDQCLDEQLPSGLLD